MDFAALEEPSGTPGGPAVEDGRATQVRRSVPASIAILGGDSCSVAC